MGTSLRVVDAMPRQHRSPNAGWPESAMAGALGRGTGRPAPLCRTHRSNDPFLNAEATRQAVPDDIDRALDLFTAACVIEAAGLRRTGIGGLTASRNAQNGVDIQMSFQMIRQRIERGFDLRRISQRRDNSEMAQPRLSKCVAGEQAVDIGALHPSVGRARAVRASIDRDHRPCAIGAFAAAEMDFITLDRRPRCTMNASDQPGGFVRSS